MRADPRRLMRRRMRRPLAHPVSWLAVGGGVAAAYAAIRPRLLRWGATPEEADAVLPGDELVPRANFVMTFAITIAAPPDAVWPWLAQMGNGRGGLYSYDWLDRMFGYLDAPSATRVLPEFQHIAAGDTIPIGKGPSWPVAAVEPERALVLEPVTGMVTWVFVLESRADGATRLVTRARGRFENGARDAVAAELMRPAAFLMTRRMLLGIRQRAEALAKERLTARLQAPALPPA